MTSWGSGIAGRDTIRSFWEVQDGGPVPEGEDLVEENWTPFWRQSFQAVQITPSLRLVPAWESAPVDGAPALRIDPGMAFGAGDHPTTRLCLQLLEELVSRGRLPPRLLDVGAGTGVLALAAARLGGGQADALDIDPFGYASCRRNATLNGLDGRIRPLLLSLDLLEASYPLVFANIGADQLVNLSAYLQRVTEPGGAVILSGFESQRELDIRKQLGISVEARLVEEDWVALLGVFPETTHPD